MTTKSKTTADLTHDTYEASLDAALPSAGLTAIDAAMVHAVRQIARTLDRAQDQLDLGLISAGEHAKAMYLTPHFVAGLRELLMTPMARATGRKPKQPERGSRLQEARKTEQERHLRSAK